MNPTDLDPIGNGCGNQDSVRTRSAPEHELKDWCCSVHCCMAAHLIAQGKVLEQERKTNIVPGRDAVARASEMRRPGGEEVSSSTRSNFALNIKFFRDRRNEAQLHHINVCKRGQLDDPDNHSPNAFNNDMRVFNGLPRLAPVDAGRLYVANPVVYTADRTNMPFNGRAY